MGSASARAGRVRPAAPGRAPGPASPVPASCCCGSAAAACAGPTCTWPRETCRPSGRTPRRATRWSPRSWRPGRAPAGSRPATGWGRPGWAGPTGPACSAAAARRTSARPRSTPAGTSTAGTPSTWWPRRPSSTRCRRFQRRRAGPAAVRRDHRLPGAAPGRGAAGRHAWGIWGFGGSAHLAAQVAMAQGAAVHVFTRAEAARELARSLGVASAQDSFDPPPVPLDSAILFAPVGTLVPAALSALDRGGTLAIAGIYLTDIPELNYERHLFQERQAPQRHLQHPGRRDRVPDPGRAAPDQGHHHPLPVRPGRPGPDRPGQRARARRRGAVHDVTQTRGRPPRPRRDLLSGAPLIDGHNDLPWALREAGCGLDGTDLSQRGQLHPDRPAPAGRGRRRRPVLVGVRALDAGGRGGRGRHPGADRPGAADDPALPRPARAGADRGRRAADLRRRPGRVAARRGGRP